MAITLSLKPAAFEPAIKNLNKGLTWDGIKKKVSALSECIKLHYM